MQLQYLCILSHGKSCTSVDSDTREQLGNDLQKIAGRYVYYYNVKYQRVGHLFQDRFKSEPVEDDAYLFRTGDGSLY